MLKIAILDERLPAQVRERPSGLDGIEVVWVGTDVDELLRRAAELKPKVIVCDAGLLGERAQAAFAELERVDSVELVLVLVHFARRDDVDALHGEKRRVVKAPVTLEGLRTQMMGVLVRQLFRQPPAERRSARPLPRPSMPAPPSIPARRYDDAQLGRLAEITTAIDCECPHHLSQLVSSLVAFEDYSARCESKDDEDAAVHRMLWVETAKARAAMEAALATLAEHEGIAL